MHTKTLAILLLFALLCSSSLAQAQPGAPASDDLPPVLIERASVAANPAEQPDNWSHAPALSGDGSLVVFLSDATNLVAGWEDTNGIQDVFVYNRETESVELISIGYDGTPAEVIPDDDEGEPSRPSISSDGRYVVYNSGAINMVISDTNTTQDVFLFDRDSGITERISVSSEEEQIEQDAFTRRPAVSAGGRYVVFYSNAHALSPAAAEDMFNIYLRDRKQGETILLTQGYDSSPDLISPANDDSYYPTISDDGKWVAFYSDASNLVEGDTNNSTDVFLYSLEQGRTWLVSVASDGTQANGVSDLPAISADGRYVAFYSYASNLVEGDTNGVADIFVHDHQTGLTELVSRPTIGGLANDESDVPSISADGRYVAFYSYASNLVLGDTNNLTDVFRYDRLLKVTVRVSLGEWLQQGDGDSQCSTISQDGLVVAFYTLAENLVEGDTNGFPDVFIRDFSRPPPDYSIRLPLICKN